MSSLFQFSLAESLALLQALKTVAMADGTFALKEQAMLIASAELLEQPTDIAELATVTGEELAAAIRNPEARVLALKACLVMAIVDGQISPEEWKVLSELRAALAIDEAQLHAFHELVHAQRQRTMHEYRRRRAVTPSATLYASEGWHGEIQFFPEDVLAAAAADPPANTRDSSELTQRYRQLASLPEATLGRELHRYYRERTFAFAGEAGAVPESLVHHDIVRILAGYRSDLEGELQTLAFTAGMRQEDPFAALFLVLLQFAASLKLKPGGALATRPLFAPDHVLRAQERGRGTAVDFSQFHDYWDLMPVPVATLRERFGIPQYLSDPAAC